jgi:spermidine/putrescine transport system permease protein
VILGSEGVITYFLRSLGLIDEPLTFLIYGPFSVFVALVYLYLPIIVFPVYVSLQKLDVDCIEAAEDLGANKLRTFLRVTLPLSSPGILVGALLVFPIITASYLESIMLGGGSLRLMYGNVIQTLYFTAGDFPMGAATSVILMIIVVSACISLVRSVRIEEIFRVK